MFFSFIIRYNDINMCSQYTVPFMSTHVSLSLEGEEITSMTAEILNVLRILQSVLSAASLFWLLSAGFIIRKPADRHLRHLTYIHLPAFLFHYCAMVCAIYICRYEHTSVQMYELLLSLDTLLILILIISIRRRHRALDVKAMAKEIMERAAEARKLENRANTDDKNSDRNDRNDRQPK